MADNLSQKSPKSGEKTKLNNAINRTTSETMRLGEPEKSINHPTSLASSTPNQRKKTPAFQITSVTVGPRISNDGGDDSADDLDESHTDDISDVIDTSRITDIENETPSYSEDTFSKEDVFFNASTTSLGTAPVIPTSSQYGLAIVPSEGGGNNLNTAVTCANSISSGGDIHVSVTEAGNVINIVSSVKQSETDMRDVHTHTGRNERFKVVKIESTEPFKRGRWMCMDYLDHTMLQQQQQSQQAIIVRSTDTSETNVGSVHYVGADSGVVITDGLSMQHGMDDQCFTDQSQFSTPAVSTISMHEHQQSLAAAQQQASMANLAAGQTTPANFTSVSPGQTLQQIPMPSSLPQVPIPTSNVATHQSLQSQQILQHTMVPDQNISQSMGSIQVLNQQHQHSQGQSQTMVNAQVMQHHSQSLSQVTIQQNIVPQQQQQQQIGQHQSLPPQQIQQVMAAASIQQLQHQSMAAVPNQSMSQQQMAHQQGFIQQQSQQMQQQQNLAQQQLSSQQGMMSSQHLAQPPQQQQYYTTNNVSGVPVSQSAVAMSQGQPSIQLISQPHSSISAQNQTLQTSTTNQQIPIMSTSQTQQPGNSMPVQVSAHQIAGGVSVSNSTSGVPLSAPVSQTQGQQIPAQPIRAVTQQQFIPQQHQHMQQQQMPSQQQMQQQAMQQMHMQQQQALQHQHGLSQQQTMQQPHGMPQQQTLTQQHGMQTPQTMQQQHGMQQQHVLPQQAMQHQQHVMPQHQTIQQPQPGLLQTQGIPQQMMSSNVTNLQQTQPPLTGMTAVGQSQHQMPMIPSNQQMTQQGQPQLVNQQSQHQLMHQGQPQMVNQQGQPQMVNQQGQSQMVNQQGQQQMVNQQGQPQMVNQQGQPQMVNQQGQAHLVNQQVQQLVNQGQPQLVQSIPPTSVIVSNVFSNTVASAPIQTFATPGPVTSTAAPRTIVTSVPQQVTVSSVIGSGGGNVNPVVGKVSMSTVTNVIDPSSGNIVGTVNNPVEAQSVEASSGALQDLVMADVASGEEMQSVATGGEDAERMKNILVLIMSRDSEIMNDMDESDYWNEKLQIRLHSLREQCCQTQILLIWIDLG